MDTYCLYYQHSNTVGTDVWEEYKPLYRNQMCGTVFGARLVFNTGTHRQEVKKAYWKRYKIDIDRLPPWVKLVKEY